MFDCDAPTSFLNWCETENKIAVTQVHANPRLLCVVVELNKVAGVVVVNYDDGNQMAKVSVKHRECRQKRVATKFVFDFFPFRITRV